jgi:hypothetical protein
MGCGETAIGVDTVSPGMIMNRTTVDSGGNAGLPGRQALHTQASSATLSQQPHPPREVDATWHLPPVFYCNSFGFMEIRASARCRDYCKNSGERIGAPFPPVSLFEIQRRTPLSVIAWETEYFVGGAVRRTCFRDWRKGYNAAT